jgi:hypothetical protein
MQVAMKVDQSGVQLKGQLPIAEQASADSGKR